MAEIPGYKNGKVDIPYWIEQLRYGLEWRRARAFEHRWPFWQKYYRGEWTSDILPYNLFFRMIRSTVPKIYFRNPSVSVVTLKIGVDHYVLSQIMESTDNTLIRRMDLKNEIKTMVQGAWMRGTGVGKLGFGSQFAVKPNDAGDTDQPAVNRGREFIEYDQGVKRNMPWFRNVHTRNYVLPWGTISPRDARWDAFIIERDLHDIKADPRLKNTADLVSGKRREVDPEAQEQKRDDDLDRIIDPCTLFEIRDRKTGKVFLITPSSEKSLLFEDDRLGELGINPAFTLVFNEDDEGCWGLPDSQILEPLQKEMNEIKTYAMYHRRLSILKILAQKDAIDPEEVNKILNGDILSVVWTNEAPKDAVMPMQSAYIPNDLYTMAEMLDSDVRDQMGMSRNQSGEFKQGSRSPTAREVAIVDEAANIRTDERRDMVADLLVKLIRDINPIIYQNWQDEQITRIVGPGGIPIWVTFTPQMLQRGQYEFKIDPDTSLPETKDLREAKALKVYEVFKTNPLINPVELTRYLLHEMHGVAFDGLMRGLPAGAGLTQEQPFSVGQFSKLIQNTATNAPQLLPAPGDQRRE